MNNDLFGVLLLVGGIGWLALPLLSLVIEPVMPMPVFYAIPMYILGTSFLTIGFKKTFFV